MTVRDAAAPAGETGWMGAAYFGDRPTFNTNRTFLEVFLLDQDIDLYGRTLLVSFVDLVRGDKTFKGVDDLVVQMKTDCEDVRRILAERRGGRSLAAGAVAGARAVCEFGFSLPLVGRDKGWGSR